MTREEILKMKPGAELDALVAKHVLKRPVNGPYSTSWGSMGVVIEHLWPISGSKRGNVDTKLIPTIWPDAEGWNCDLTGAPVIISVTATTAPEAVCKAALIAELKCS